MSHGVPVIAWERGCIGGIINHKAGLAIPHSMDFVESAVKQIIAWHKTPWLFAKVRQDAIRRFLEIRSQSGRSLELLLKALLSTKSETVNEES